jgi:hypothetical protein
MLKSIKIKDESGSEVEYVRKDTQEKQAEDLNGYPFRIVRTYSAGVFAGYLKYLSGKESVVLNAIRLWRWAGAASLSQLAMEGTICPSECKFTMPVIGETTLTETIEVLSVTEKAKKSIAGVAVWKV